MHGTWPIPCLSDRSHMQIVEVFLCKRCATLNKVGPCLQKGNSEMCLARVEECPWSIVCWERKSSVSVAAVCCVVVLCCVVFSFSVCLETKASWLHV